MWEGGQGRPGNWQVCLGGCLWGRRAREPRVCIRPGLAGPLWCHTKGRRRSLDSTQDSANVLGPPQGCPPTAPRVHTANRISWEHPRSRRGSPGGGGSRSGLGRPARMPAGHSVSPFSAFQGGGMLRLRGSAPNVARAGQGPQCVGCSAGEGHMGGWPAPQGGRRGAGPLVTSDRGGAQITFHGGLGAGGAGRQDGRPPQVG